MTRKLWTGVIIVLSGCVFLLKSAKKESLATSTADAEYNPMSTCAMDIKLCKLFLSEICFDMSSSIPFCFEESAANFSAEKNFQCEEAKQIKL